MLKKSFAVIIMLVLLLGVVPVAGAIPPGFQLLSPSDGAHIPMGETEFMWGVHEDAEYYALTIKEAETGELMAYIAQISPLACNEYICSQSLTLNFEPMTEYKWNIKAYWDEGESKEKSEVWYFWLWLWP